VIVIFVLFAFCFSSPMSRRFQFREIASAAQPKRLTARGTH